MLREAFHSMVYMKKRKEILDDGLSILTKIIFFLLSLIRLTDYYNWEREEGISLWERRKKNDCKKLCHLMFIWSKGLTDYCIKKELKKSKTKNFHFIWMIEREKFVWKRRWRRSILMNILENALFDDAAAALMRWDELTTTTTMMMKTAISAAAKKNIRRDKLKNKHFQRVLKSIHLFSDAELGSRD